MIKKFPYIFILFITSISFNAKAQNYLLGNDTTLCGGESITLNPFTNATIFPDSLVITYDASQGQTQLVGATKVYFHSGYQVIPFGSVVGWVGNWGQDDGLGQMRSLGNNLWTIAINLNSYYSLLPGTNLNAIVMVFRNQDGTLTGKDDTGNDIYLVLNPLPPTTAFNGVTGFIKRDNFESILWSTGATSPTITVNNGGNYSFISTDTLGVSSSDDIVVSYSSAQLNLGNDVALCGTSSTLLNAGAGFTSYLWNTGQTSQTINVTNTGVYSVSVTAGNCILHDTINVAVSAISYPPISLGNDTTFCGGAQLNLNTGITLSPFGDSLKIVYDATQGQTGLVGAAKVYMHSGYQEIPFGAITGWVGNWGLDDGLGQMTAIGNDLWQITINLQSYYGVSAQFNINALSIIFRNEDGTQTGKDNGGNDIFLVLSPTPNSSFGGITGTYTASPYTSILWSNGAPTADITINSTGTYSVQVTTNSGCILSDSISVGFAAIPFVDAGTSQNICVGDSIILDAGAGFNSYNWSTGATSPSILVNQAGTYSISVTNAFGCTGIDIVNIAILPAPVASFTFNVTGGGIIYYTNTSTDATSLSWDFNGDGNNDNTTQNPFYTYFVNGTYNVRLIATNSCGSDTVIVPVNTVGIQNLTGAQMINLSPNPATDFINLQIPNALTNAANYAVFNLVGNEVMNGNFSASQKNKNINIEQLSSGIYFIKVATATAQQTIKFIKK